MGNKRKQHSKEFKARVALEAVKGVKSLSELASEFKLHSTQIRDWKLQITRNAADLFERGYSNRAMNEDALTAPLYQTIGRLKVEADFLRKKC